MVLGLYRDEFYNPQTTESNILEVSILKNRNGSTGGNDKLLFTAEILKMSDLTVTNSAFKQDDYGF